MKNKKITLTLITLCALIITVISCRKSDIAKKDDNASTSSSLALRESQEADNPEMVEYYSNHFLNDSAMAFVFEKFIVSSVKARGIVLEHGGSNSLEDWDALVHNYTSYSALDDFYLGLGIDTSEMIGIHADPMASWLNLLVKNPNFHELTMNDQELVLRNLQTTLTDTFEEENPNNILIKTIRDLINTDPVAQARGITMSEAVGCAVGAVASTIRNGWDTIKQLVDVINGYNLGWSGIRSVAISAIRSVFGSNVGGMLFDFAVCMVWAYIF